MPCVWGYWVVAHIVAATATGFNSICPNKLNHTREDDEGERDIKMSLKKLASHDIGNGSEIEHHRAPEFPLQPCELFDRVSGKHDQTRFER